MGILVHTTGRHFFESFAVHSRLKVLWRLPLRHVDELETGIGRNGTVQSSIDVSWLGPKVLGAAVPVG